MVRSKGLEPGSISILPKEKVVPPVANAVSGVGIPVQAPAQAVPQAVEPPKDAATAANYNRKPGGNSRRGPPRNEVIFHEIS